MKHILFSSACALALLVSSAQAQTAPAGGQPKSAAAASSAASDQGGLEEVVVTAERKEQSAQKAPIAISVVQPDELTRENIVRAEDLSRAVPALMAANNGGANTTFFLRGVGNFTSNSYSDPAIAFNYDGVYIGRPTNTQGEFYDLQRVEVLKGPQGTLYGRNATGGAINVIPNYPVLDETSGEIQASYGNYNAVQLEGDVNLPVGEDNALRLAGTYSRHDGYLSDGTSDQDLYGLRAQFLSDLSADLTNRIDVDYAHDGGKGTGSYQYGATVFNGVGYSFIPSGLDPKIGLGDPRSSAYLGTQFITQVGRYAEALGTKPSLDDASWGITDELNWKTSAGTLTILPAYRESTINSVYTTDDFRDGLTDETDRQYSVEARFAGSAGALDYVVGGYYFKENIKDHLAINQLVLTAFQDYKTGTDSKAAFGQLSYHVTDTFTLTAGGRYTADHKSFDGLSDNYTLFCGNGQPGNSCLTTLPLEPYVRTGAELANYYTSRSIPVSTAPLFLFAPPDTPTVFEQTIPIDATTKSNKFTYRLAADWQVAPDSLLYASYETGFHGGGFSFARGIDSYKPETIGAYTIGSKNRFFDDTLQFNVEAFYWNYKNQQFSQFGYDLGTPPALVFYTSNVGSSTNKGIDADLDYLLTPTTQISGSVQYLDTRYNKFISYAPNLGGVPPDTACPFTSGTFNGQPGYQIDCSGRSGFNAPKWSFNLGIAQTVQLDGYQLVLQGGTRYRGSFYDSPTYQPWVVSKGAFQSDASVTLSPNAGSWSVAAFINNIENKRRILLTTTNAINTYTATTSDPRTFGIRIDKKFD